MKKTATKINKSDLSQRLKGLDTGDLELLIKITENILFWRMIEGNFEIIER